MKQLPDFYPAKGKLDPEAIFPSFVTKPKDMTKKDWKQFVDEKVDESMFLEYGKPKSDWRQRFRMAYDNCDFGIGLPNVELMENFIAKELAQARKEERQKLNITKDDVKAGFTSIICKKCGKEFHHYEPEVCDLCKSEDMDAPYW
jgi:hypothetical protein